MACPGRGVPARERLPERTDNYWFTDFAFIVPVQRALINGDIEAQQRLQDRHVTAAGDGLRGTPPLLAVVTGDSRVIAAMISHGLVHEGAPAPASKDAAETVRGKVVGSSRSMHNRLICASQRAETCRPPAAPIRRCPDIGTTPIDPTS